MDREHDLSDSDASIEHPPGSGGRKTKRRRLHGACDTCRRKKIKCDSAVMPSNICSHCISTKAECTHNIPRQKKRETQQEYIRTLEERLHRMEEFLRMTPPDSNVNTRSGTSPESVSEASPRSFATFPDPPLPFPRTIPDVNEDQPASQLDLGDVSDPEDLVHVSLAENLKHLSVDATKNRFFGKASAFSFAQHATTVKNEYAGVPDPNFARARRPAYWNLRPWEREYAYSQEVQYVFPEPDLIASLISLYFEKVNIILPVLHQPTFQKAVASGQYLSDQGFGMVLLMVCAVASRYTSDPRVLLVDDEDGLSSGWKYISQIPLARRSLVERTKLYDLQYYSLAVLYFIGTGVPQTAWNMLGLGLRLTQEQGIHRRRGTGHPPAVEEELQKRAFWCMVSLDRFMSSFLGRPCMIQEEDVDVDYPIECDDEYWEPADPSHAFKQPPGRPSLIAAFNHHLKLCEMVAFTLRTLYSTKKSKILAGRIGDQWEECVVAELDSSMNKWRDSLPQYLRWDPTNPDRRFFDQSTSLHASFYYLQIQVHRPFLQKRSSLSLSSLAICTNAARSCSHVVDSALKRGLTMYPNILVEYIHLSMRKTRPAHMDDQMATFASATVLVINMCGSFRSKVTYELAKEMDDIQKCLDVLKEGEKRWHVAGRLGDMLIEFSSLRDAPSFTTNMPTSSKRSREVGGDSSTSTGRPKTSAPSNVAHNFAPATSIQYTPDFMDTGRNSQNKQVQARTPSLAVNDWNSSNLLLERMGYAHGFVFDGTEGQHSSNSSGFKLPVNPFIQHTPEPEQPTKANFQSPFFSDRDDNTMSMWMTAPTAFSLEEWDSYIASMSQLG